MGRKRQTAISELKPSECKVWMDTDFKGALQTYRGKKLQEGGKLISFEQAIVETSKAALKKELA